MIINHEGEIRGFSLSTVYVAGPIAENNAIARHTIQDVGQEDGSMTVDLEQAEQQELSLA